MSPKIVFNGREYDDLAGMPPDVRAQYQAVLAQLGTTDRAQLESALGSGSALKVSVKVERKFRINGREYASLHEMPADVRLLYERAVASDPSLAVPPTTTPASGLPYLPPPIDAEDGTRSRRLVLVIAAALVAAVLAWLLAHH